MSFNSQQKFRDNLEALRIALEWQEGKELAATEVDALRRFAGFGGLKAVLFPAGPKEDWSRLSASQADLQLYPIVMELHELLKKFYDDAEYKAVLASLRNSVLTAFYTPSVVPQTFFDVLKQRAVCSQVPCAMSKPFETRFLSLHASRGTPGGYLS